MAVDIDGVELPSEWDQLPPDFEGVMCGVNVTLRHHRDCFFVEVFRKGWQEVYRVPSCTVYMSLCEGFAVNSLRRSQAANRQST